MTELDTFKALLDQRGEPYVVNDFGVTWRYTSDPHTATESMDGTLIVTGLTARQAIDATLGRVEWYDEDGTLHICCHRLPDHIKVTLPDSRGREVYSAKVHKFEPVRECHIKPWHMEHDTGFYDCMECDECGHVMDNSEWARANFCSCCGSHVAGVTA